MCIGVVLAGEVIQVIRVEDLDDDQVEDLDEDQEYQDGVIRKYLPYLTFGTSVLSGALGIAKFMKVGPFRLVPIEKFCGGFLLLVGNIAISIVLKAASIAFIFLSFFLHGSRLQLINVILFWILFNFAPQLLLVSINTCYIEI